MPSSLILQVHGYMNIFKYSKIPLCFHSMRNRRMNLEGIFLAVLFAVFATFISKHFFTPSTIFFKDLIDLGLTTFSSYPLVPILIPYNINSHHHHHNKKVSICDDFRRDFLPPDTNTTATICVDRNGCCNFTAVQAAVDSVGVFSQKRTIIWINTGIYFEKVIVPRTKPNITFQGQGFESTAIMWNDTANSANGTFYSGSVQVFAENFMARNISFLNVAPIPVPGAVGAQAVAMRIAGDRASFWGCGFFGAQDTLHDDRGRHYFRDCFIQGSIDFIFGDARSFYENCQLSSIANSVPVGVKTITGAVTAHGRASSDENTGFVFFNCSVGGTGRIWLGRAWRPFSRVIFAYTTMTDIIAPEGWNDFNDVTRDQSIFYGEYMCSGGGANMTMRAPYVQRLNDSQASPFLKISFIDGDQWL